MPEKVLVTGSSGFLGARIVARLQAEGHAVTGLDPMPPAPGATHQHIADDLSSAARLGALLSGSGITRVIHAGGVSGPMVLTDQPLRIMAVNVAGSLALLDASIASAVRSFVYCSSLAAIGVFDDVLTTDDPPMRPDTPYGASKAAVDQVLRGLYGRVPTGICSLRLTSLYGPGRRTGNHLTALVAAALAGREARIPPGSAMPLIFVEDAAAAAVAAAFATTRRQLFYTIAHPALVSLEDIAAALQACGVPVRTVTDPALRANRRGRVSAAAAQRDLGFEARIDHREGVRRMVAAARHQPSA